jgi:hypothetical protein
MKSSIQKVKPTEKLNNENGPKDFVALSKEIGYIRARQLLKQVSVKRHQEKIDNVDAKKMHEYRPARLKNAVHQSMTYGAPALESEIVFLHILFPLLIPFFDQEKMMASVNKTRVNREGNKEELSEEDLATKNRGLDCELSLSRSLITEELYMSQLHLDHLPAEMGDTLFLQLSHVKKLACMRNNFTGLLSPTIPQASCHPSLSLLVIFASLTLISLSHRCPHSIFGILRCFPLSPLSRPPSHPHPLPPLDHQSHGK